MKTRKSVRRVVIAIMLFIAAFLSSCTKYEFNDHSWNDTHIPISVGKVYADYELDIVMTNNVYYDDKDTPHMFVSNTYYEINPIQIIMCTENDVTYYKMEMSIDTCWDNNKHVTSFATFILYIPRSQLTAGFNTFTLDGSYIKYSAANTQKNYIDKVIIKNFKINNEYYNF